MNHLKLYENYEVDEMEPHINFHDHKKYLPFLDDYDVKMLYNQLNDLHWQMEQIVTDDDSANEWSTEEEKVRRELDQAVVNSDIRKAEEEKSKEDEYYKSLLIDYLSDELKLTDKDYHVTNLEVEDEEATFTIEFDGEEMEFRSNFRYDVIWEDSMEDVEFGNLENKGQVADRFKEYANSYDDALQEFIDKYKLVK